MNFQTSLLGVPTCGGWARLWKLHCEVSPDLPGFNGGFIKFPRIHQASGIPSGSFIRSIRLQEFLCNLLWDPLGFDYFES